MIEAECFKNNCIVLFVVLHLKSLKEHNLL